MKLKVLVVTAGLILATVGFIQAETVTIATVNNGDMIRMQKLSDDFTANEPRH